jgi:MFS family permease
VLTKEAETAQRPARFPPGLHNAYFFSAFNALSYQVVLSSPMVLYAKSLGASATVLGIVAGMMPLLVIFQIPAASYIPRLGFKHFVYAGWGVRVLFIFAMALVPLTGGFLNKASRMGLMLALLFGFNLSRGISSCAWLPWITALVPAELRGRYLTRDAAVQNSASFLAFLVAAGCLAGSPRSWQFAVLFVFSAVMGAVSLRFLKRIPDAEVPEEARGQGRVPWLEMVRFPPFAKLLREALAWAVAFGGMTAFTVAFLKAQAGMSEGKILALASVGFLGGLSSLWLIGSRLDRLGSKPVLSAAYLTWVAVCGGWMLIAGQVLPIAIGLVMLLQFFTVLLTAVVQMSNIRLAMEIVPVMGRNHFFAIYSVITNVTLGLAPIGWGLLIDAVGNRSAVWLGLDWNRFTIFFAGAALALLAGLVLTRRLEEQRAASLEELLRDFLSQSPLRIWLRFWPR